MACTICNLESSESICRLCQALLERPPRLCKECGLELPPSERISPFCRLCNTMFETVRASHWLSSAQAEWEEENYARAQRKRVLLGAPPDEQDPFAG